MKFKKLNENIDYGLDKIKDPILFDTNGLDKETIEVLRYLDHEGYDANAKDVRNYADAVAEYIDVVRSTGEDYSVADWYRDTTENYPEELSDLSIRDYDYSDIASESLSEAYVLDSEADWALDNKLVQTDLYTKVYGGKLSHVFKSEIDGRLYALELDPSADGYRYVGTFPEYCEKITPEITQRMVAQRMLEDLGQNSGWEDPEWRKYWGVDDDSFYDDPIRSGVDLDDYDLDEEDPDYEAHLSRLGLLDDEGLGESFDVEDIKYYAIIGYEPGDGETGPSGDKFFIDSEVVAASSEDEAREKLNADSDANIQEVTRDDYEEYLEWSKQESLNEQYDQYEPDQNYMYDPNYYEYVYDIETAAEDSGRNDRLAGDKLKTKEEFLSTFDTSYDDRPEDEQDDEVLYFYYKKGYNKKRKFKDGRVYPELKEDKEILYIIKDRQGHQLSRPNPDDNELWDRVDSMDPYGKKGYRVVVYTDESLSEDTIKQNGKWVNKGKEGTHGKFNTKKQADAQRKAMFANGYNEDWNTIDQIDAPETIGKLNPGDKFKNRNGVIITIIDPMKDGTIQYKIQSKNYPYEVRYGKEKSIQQMLYRNNYIRI